MEVMDKILNDKDNISPSTCLAHSGISATIDAGTDMMKRLETGMRELRADFNANVSSQSKKSNAIMMLVLATLITALASVYVNAIGNSYKTVGSGLSVIDDRALVQLSEEIAKAARGGR